MEKVVVFNIKSDLGSFKRPSSNNNPSTFHIMTKSALIGIIGAVVGLDWDFMKISGAYESLTEKLQYSIRLRAPFQIKYWSEYGYNHHNMVYEPTRPIYTPTKFERLINVEYDVYVLYDGNDTEVSELMQNFTENVKKNEFIFPPYMGMANFHSDLKFIGEYAPQQCNGKFKTATICTNLVMTESLPFEHIRTDDIPTRNISYLAYNRDSYKTIYFHDSCGFLEAEGNYYQIGEEMVEFI